MTARRRLPFTPEQIATIRAMREAGATWRAIGAATSRSHVGCRRYWIRGWAALADGRGRPVGESRLQRLNRRATALPYPLAVS